uniref:GTPase family protein n=1 Tax=Babesia bovis TaxID=5865 RepID=A7AQJ3_BABBO|eukprot:XP_001610380.1 GTPase family protein [Babesia bovis T2Bo]
MLVRGGRGGKGNRYYKTKFNPTPHVCELGEEGFKRELLLNYKMLGNLALIGKPNSGKSSLLRCLSNARPRVSNQAFSTKFPILGVFKINDQADVDPDNDTTQDSHRTTGEINTEINDICRNANNEQDESDNECPLIKSHTPNAFSHTSLISEVTDGYKDTDDDVFDDNVNPEHNGDSQYTPPIPLKSLEDQAAYNKDSSKSYSHLYGFRCRNKYAIQNDSPPVSSENGSYILDGETKGGTLNKDKSLSTDLCVDELSSITDELSSGLDTMSDCTTESGDTQDNSYSEDDSDAYLEEDSFHTAAAMEELCDITPDVPTSQVKKQLVIADVPGLIQGASSGKGLGHKFLKHIENSNVLTYVIDSSVTDPLQDYIDVKNEIFTYNPDLLSRLELIILNKIDLIDHAKVEQLVKEFTEEVNHTRIYPVSAKTRANMYMLENSFKWIYRLPMTKKEIDRKPISLAIDDPDDFRKLNPRKFKVEKIAEGKFRIISDYLQRKIPMMRFDIRESLDRLRRILRINRIHLKLKKMGVEQGDTLQIGDMSFCVNELAC